MVAINFSTQGVAPNAALEPLPSGIYDVIIIRTEEKPTKAGDGSYIEFEMQVQGGEMNGRKVFDRLNIRNGNQQAVDIAYGTLSAICHVTGRHQIQDTAQLHGIPFKAVVAKVERKDKPGTFSNEVNGYKDAQGNDPGKAGSGAAPAAAPNWAQGQGGGAPPQQNGAGYGGPPQQYQPPQQGYGQGQVPQQGQPPQQYQPGPGQQPHVGENHAVNAPQQGGAPQGGQPPAWAGNGGGQPPQQNYQQQPPQQNGAPQQGQQPFTPGAAPPWVQNGGQPQAGA